MDGTILDKKYNIVGRIEALEAGGGGGGYVLPIATDETLGGIKVGNGLEINSETGVLSNTNPTPYTPVAYSTAEQNTGQKWIDGKDIYKKVITFETPLDLASQTWTDTGALSGAETIISVFSIGSSGGAYTPLGGSPSYSAQAHNFAVLNFRNTVITVSAICFEYTKATVTRTKKK